MKNFIQPGNTLTVAAPAAVASGAVVLVGKILGVAAAAAGSGEPVEVAIEGVYEVP